MPLDPSIILANADPRRQFDPTDAIAKALQMKGMQQQQQARQQEMQDAADFKSQYGVSPGMAQARQKMQLGEMEATKTRHEAAKMELEALNAFKDQQWQTYGQATPENWPQVKAQAAANAQAFAQKMGKELPPGAGADDEEVFDPRKHEQRMKGLLSFDRQLKMAAQKMAEEKANQEKWDKVETSTGFARFNRQTGEMEPIAGGLKPAPKGSSISLGLGGSGGLTEDALAMQVERYRRTGDLPGVGQGKAGTELRMKIMNAAAAADKAEGKVTDLAEAKKSFKTQVDAQKFFTTGKGADAMRQQETILHHAKVFQDIADALDNGNIQLANRLGNTFGLQMGSDKATNLKMAGQIFSAEVGKYLAGSMGSAEERAELAKLMPMFNSPEQFKGGLKTLSNLVEGQRRSWMRQRTAALSGKVTDESVTPGHDTGTKPLPQSMIGTLPPKVAQDYLAGKKVKGPDGTIYQKGN